MTEIKERKQLTKIIFYDGEPLSTEIPKEEIDKLLNSDGKFMIFGDRTINKSNIREICLYKPDKIEGFILSRPEYQRGILRQHIINRKSDLLDTTVGNLEKFCLRKFSDA